MASIADAMKKDSVGGEDAPVVVVAELDEGQLQQQELEKKKRDEQLARLDAMGQSLAKTRSEAIQARQSSGIEDEWLEDEEFYQGVDDANRNEVRSGTWRRKPPGQAQNQTATTTRSTVFPNITRPYVDAAAARISDMLLPTDDKSWAIKPTPIPSAQDAAIGKYQPDMLKEAAQLYPGDAKKAQNHLALATQAALEVIAEAKAKSEKASTRIEDWHVECQWHAHVRSVIEDAARIGTGILKGPIPMKRSQVCYRDGRMQMMSKITPGSKWIDPWNFFPDGACGENIHNGGYTWERDYITKKQLRALRGQDDYIDEQIDACITEGATRAIAEYKPTPDILVTESYAKDKFEIWYYHGVAERVDLEAAGCDCGEDTDPHMPAMVVMVNNRVIKAVLNPLETGDFPYDVMVWQKRSGFWAGMGVGRHIRTPQRIVTAATRNLMDNAGLASGPMLVFRQGVIFPADGIAGIAPRKIWYIAQEAEEIDDATKAIGQIKVDMLVDELMKVIELGLKLAEDVTGLPMLLQGQQGKAPDTLGGMQMLNNNASAVLRRLARLFDDRVTEPHVRRYYVWLLQDPEVPDSEKGDYQIDARGSSALVERDLQNQAVMQMGHIVTNPMFGLDPKKWAAEYLKSQRLDVKRFEFDDDKWEQIVANLAKGGNPAMAVAQFRAETEQKLTAMEQSFKAQENERDRQLTYIIEEMKLGNLKDITLDKLKGMLADTTIKTRTQRDLSPAGKGPQVTTPPTEPAGRAAKGQAYAH